MKYIFLMFKKQKQKTVVQFWFTFGCLFIVFSSCGTSTHEQKGSQHVILNDSSTIEGVHRYMVYIPSTQVDCKELPLLLIIDPHAGAAKALAEFIPGAEKYKYILVASATLKNNYPEFAHAINILLDDVKSKYPINSSIYIAGFSGGARMALNYAQYTPVMGIIACGALTSPDQINAVQSPVIAIAGMADFNFIETAQYIFKPEEAPTNLRLEITEEIHTWPSADLLSNAMGYFQAINKRGNPCGENDRWRKRFTTEQKERIDSLIIEGNILNADLIARNMSAIKGKSKHEDFTALQKSIESSSDYMAILAQLKESIRFELDVRNAYYDALQSKNAVWWEKELSSLQSKMEEDKDYFRGLTYQRIKGFIGIMCYSLCNNSLRLNDFINSERLLSIYQLVEPENIDMLYFYALYYQRTDKPDKALEFLTHAVKAGYSDKLRIAEDFPERISKEAILLIMLDQR